MPNEQFPNASKTVRPQPAAPTESKTDEVRTEKVVTSTVVVRKKPWHKRALETFVGTDDAKSVGAYIAQDVIVPAIKDVVVDAVTQAVERMVFGESRGRSSTRRGRDNNAPSFVNYQSMSRTMNNNAPTYDISRRARETHNFGEIVIPKRAEADAVLTNMFACLSQYDAVTVAELYSLVGISPSFMDHKYGWFGPDGLRGARFDRVRDGYLLRLPAPEPIPNS